MGGYSSGRYRTRNRGAVENTLRLDIRRLRRLGFVRPGAAVSGVIRWEQDGQDAGSIGLSLDLMELSGGHAKLTFAVQKESRQQSITVASEPCRLGGLRYYFICPRSLRRCEVLCCVGGVFASRQYHRLSYSSQTEDPLGRLHRARLKAESRLYGKGGRAVPRGANRERLVARWIAYEEATDQLFAVVAVRRFSRLGMKWPDDF